jgi:hypothetical protein
MRATGGFNELLVSAGCADGSAVLCTVRTALRPGNGPRPVLLHSRIATGRARAYRCRDPQTVFYWNNMRRRSRYLAAAVVAGIVGLIIVKVIRLSPRALPIQRRPIAQVSRPLEHVGPGTAYPQQDRTPGIVNPEITQANISQTICNPDWSTKLVRPPESYTSHLKTIQMRELALPGTTADYEEDHFISLELGGSPTDPRNLWPESYLPRPGAREKDVVERYLHKQVCLGALTLDQAQKAITTDWYRIYTTIHP